MQKTAIAALVFSHIINDMAGGFFPPLAPLLAERLGLSLTLIGLVLSLRGMANSLPQPLFGWMIDRHPSRWWLLLTPIVVVPFRSAIGNATGFWTLTLFLCAAAAGGSCYHPAAAARARELAGKFKGLGVGGYIAGGRLGQGIGPIVALAFVSWFGLQGLIYASAFGVVSMAALSFLPPPPAAPKRTKKPEASAKPARKFSLKPFLILYAASIMRNTVAMNMAAYIPLYFAARGQSLWAGGWALTIYFVSGSLGTVCGGWFSDRAGRKTALLLPALLAFPLLFLFLTSSGLFQLAIIGPLGVLIYSAFGTRVVFAQELLPGRPALAASLIQGGNWFVSGITLTGIGVLGDRIGIESALFALIGVLGAECLISFWLPGKKKMEE